MPLPPRSFYAVTELAQRWGMTPADLVTYAVDGKLELCVLTCALPVDCVPAHQENARRLVLSGPQPVMAEDLWSIRTSGTARLDRLKPCGEESSRSLVNGDASLLVNIAELVMTAEECRRVELAYDLAPEEPALNAPPFTHTADYRELTCGGRAFRLGARQADIVRQLHQAAQTPEPWVSGAILLEHARSGSDRIVDLFKTQEHWRSLILSDRKGRWRLNVPTSAQSRAHRAYRRQRLIVVSSRD